MVDVSKSTLEHLDELLGEVSEGMDGPSDWPPPQEKECMTVAALNLLNLQVLLIFYGVFIVVNKCRPLTKWLAAEFSRSVTFSDDFFVHSLRK